MSLNFEGEKKINKSQCFTFSLSLLMMLSSLSDKLEAIDNEINITYIRRLHGELILEKNNFIIKKTYDHSAFGENNIQLKQDLVMQLYSANNKLFVFPYSIVIDYYPSMTTDYFSGGDLEYVMKHQEKHSVTQTEKLIIAYGIAKAIEVLHSLNLYHEKLNIASILLDENYFPALSDILIDINQITSDENRQKNINDYADILKFIDDNTQAMPLFSSIIDRIKNHEEQSINIDNILDLLYELGDNRNCIDINKFGEYISFINSNDDISEHGTLQNVDTAMSNGLMNAIETAEQTIEILKTEKIIS